MLESYDEDCDATYFDNILVTRASPQRFCDGVEGYDSVCEGLTEFHPSVDQSSYIALPVCNVLVSTNGGTCKDYCASQGRVCRHAQDNLGAGCGLDSAHDRQTMEQNGCLQNWGNQICGCAEADDDIDSMVFHATSNEGTEPDVVLRTRHGSECQLFNTPGGCDGSDSGRCGVTADGELYAYLLRQTFLLILSPSRSTDLFGGAGTITMPSPGARKTTPTAASAWALSCGRGAPGPKGLGSSSSAALSTTQRTRTCRTARTSSTSAATRARGATTTSRPATWI